MIYIYIYTHKLKMKCSDYFNPLNSIDFGETRTELYWKYIYVYVYTHMYIYTHTHERKKKEQDHSTNIITFISLARRLPSTRASFIYCLFIIYIYITVLRITIYGEPIQYSDNALLYERKERHINLPPSNLPSAEGLVVPF